MKLKEFEHSGLNIQYEALLLRAIYCASAGTMVGGIKGVSKQIIELLSNQKYYNIQYDILKTLKSAGTLLYYVLGEEKNDLFVTRDRRVKSIEEFGEFLDTLDKERQYVLLISYFNFIDGDINIRYMLKDIGNIKIERPRYIGYNYKSA